MEEKVEAVRTFLDSRMLWTAYTRDISARLPPNAATHLLQRAKRAGRTVGRAKAVGGSFQLQGMAPLSPDGSMPREIDAFLGAIPNDPLWKRDFASDGHRHQAALVRQEGIARGRFHHHLPAQDKMREILERRPAAKTKKWAK